MGKSGDRRQMMLAKGFERDVAQRDDLIIAAGFIKRPPQQRFRVFAIALEPLLVGPRHPPRRVPQTLAIRIIPGP